MSLIVNEPFEPKRRSIKSRTPYFRWWRVFVALISVIAFKGHSS